MQGDYYLKVDDCPLYAWRKAHDGDLTALRKKGGNKESDSKAFDELYKDFIAKIGFSKEFKEYLDLIQRKTELQFQYMESEKNGIRNRFLLNKINAVLVKLEKYQNLEVSKQTITSVLLKLGKMQGYHIKEREITILEYYELIKDYTDGGTKD